MFGNGEPISYDSGRTQTNVGESAQSEVWILLLQIGSKSNRAATTEMDGLDHQHGSSERRSAASWHIWDFDHSCIDGSRTRRKLFRQRLDRRRQCPCRLIALRLPLIC